MLPAPLASAQALRDQFVDGLQRLLEQPALGAYILVCANATFDEEVMARCGIRLRERLRDHLSGLRDVLAQGREPEVAADDLQVFLRLLALDEAGLVPRETHRVGPWQVQFNLLRAFRPQRASGQVIRELSRPFEAQKFHFDKPFLRQEVFWEGALLGRAVQLLYNKFPFARYHGLLVPEVTAGHPQLLTETMHHYIWQVTGALADNIPEIGIGYNALGAGASVNHLHFQTFVEARLPLEQMGWQHMGGAQDYPLVVEHHADVQGAWAAIEARHREGMPYNLIYRAGGCYLVQRGWQGEVVLPQWLPTLTWYEAAGGITCFNRAQFEALEADEVTAALALLNAD